MFPASVLTGVQAIGSRQGAAVGCRAQCTVYSLLALAAARLNDAATAADIMEFSTS